MKFITSYSETDFLKTGWSYSKTEKFLEVKMSKYLYVRQKRWLFLLIFLLCPLLVSAADFHIGPGQAHTTIGAFPWSSLASGDTVYIHAKANQEPYYEKLYVGAAFQGTESNPISIIGVPDGNGNKPILSGDGATVGPNFDTYGDPQYHSDLGLLTFDMGGAAGYASYPQWVIVKDLVIQDYCHDRSEAGKCKTTITDENGTTKTVYKGAGVSLRAGVHITLDGLEIANNSDGIFGKDQYSPVEHITVKNCNIHGNGIANQTDNYVHNIYTEVKYLTVEKSTFGPLVAEAPGNNIKDRGVGTIIRYNYIEDGGHLIDFVECQDNCTDHTSDPAWADAFVYGNVLYASEDGPAAIIHFGTGDKGADPSYWRHNLYFYNNTVVYKRDQSVSWYVGPFKLTGSNQTAYVDNNIFYIETATEGGNLPQRVYQYDSNGDGFAAGNLVFGKNWFSLDWLGTRPGYTVTGTVTGESNNIFQMDNNPYFVDVENNDFHLAAGSTALGAAGALPTIISSGNALGLDLTPVAEYGTEVTRVDLEDIGAFYSSYAPNSVVTQEQNGSGSSSEPDCSAENACPEDTPSVILPPFLHDPR